MTKKHEKKEMKHECIFHSTGDEHLSSTCPLKNKLCTYEDFEGCYNLEHGCAIIFRVYGLSHLRYNVPQLREDDFADHPLDE